LSERKEKVPVKERAERKAEIAPWRATEFLREMDRMFEDFKKGFEYMLAPIRTGWMRPWLPVLKLPESREACADIIDAGNEYRICAEVPGIPKEKLDITITPRSIEISGEARTDIREEKEGFVRQERGYSKIHRSLTFPDEVVPDKAEAALKDGLLEIRVPKKTPTEVKKHRVQIK